MKMIKKIITSVFTAALLISLSAVSILAAEKESYTYSVTFYTGVQGSFNGTAGLSVDNGNAVISQTADKIVVSGLNAGDRVSYNAQAGVSLEDSSKYYVQGVRLSGRDNDTVAASVFTVEKDADYVVAYGIQGNMTSYTVNYQTANGTQLAQSQTFYGNVGDKPVVAYQYIEGYAPQAFGLTKTLSENASDNVFTFVYEVASTTTVQTVTQTTTGTTTDSTTGTTTGTTTDGTTGTTTGTTDGTTDGTTTDNASDTAEDGAAAETTTGEEGTAEDGTVTDDAAASEEETETPEIVDLDEEDVPLAESTETGSSSAQKSMPIIACAVIAVAAVLGIAYAGILIKRRRR